VNPCVSDWNATELGRPLDDEVDPQIILPLVVNYLTPRPVAIIGGQCLFGLDADCDWFFVLSTALAALCAAVMSSIDSAVLSASTLFTHNIYRLGLRPKVID
jgi:high affinity choline transporter 7